MTKWNTAQIRATATQEAEGGWGGIEPEDFDEWLAEVIREARYEGFNEGAREQRLNTLGLVVDFNDVKNPYGREQ